jgi:hypothetical protein
MRVPHVISNLVLLFLIQFGLNGCIQPDKNLLSDTDTVTPLPKVLYKRILTAKVLIY